jgi:thiamine biosynthesis lipoprotein
MTKNAQKTSLINCSGESPHNAHRFSHKAMATVYEIIIISEDARYAEQCAHEAFNELDRLEQELSRFIENSDISRINASGFNQPVSVGLDTFECLEHCARLYQSTQKAFDITIGPLLKIWLDSNKNDRAQSHEGLSLMQKSVGMHLVELNKDRHTVTVRSNTISIDLGGYGKGYAVDRMADVLQEWDIESALIHGGTSSVLALGSPSPEEKGWQVTLRSPEDYDTIIARLNLQNRAINGSGIRKGQHIIDPRTGYPAAEKNAVWAVSTSASTGDALSTAFMIMTPEEINDYCAGHNDTQALIIVKKSGHDEQIMRFGEFEHNE